MTMTTRDYAHIPLLEMAYKNNPSLRPYVEGKGHLYFVWDEERRNWYAAFLLGGPEITNPREYHATEYYHPETGLLMARGFLLEHFYSQYHKWSSYMQSRALADFSTEHTAFARVLMYYTKEQLEKEKQAEAVSGSD